MDPALKTRHFFVAFLVTILTTSWLFWLPRSASAAALIQTMVRLDRVAPNTSLSGLVCATPSAAGAGVEGQVKVTFPSDFSLSTNTSHWTTGTTNIPPDATAWSGISTTAQSVSGTTVTFTSTDLSSGSTNYCFTFSAISSTTGGSGPKVGTLTTATSGGNTIDAHEYGMTVGNDRVSVSATVPAKSSDFSVILRKLSPPRNIFRQSEIIEYEIEYTNHLGVPALNTAIEATWSQGTIAGSGVPTVDVIEYLSNSATTAINGAPGVIDPLNRTITWTIGSLPAQTTSKVRFKMQTTNNYSGQNDVSFDVSSRLLAEGTATSYETLTSMFRYDYNPPVSVTPTNTPNTSPPSPTPRQVPFRFDELEIRSLSKDTAVIDIRLSHAGTIRASYGLTPRNLMQQITTLTRSRFQTVTFSGLNERTPYYFRLTATDASGKTITSDIYTFTTAKPVAPPEISPDSFIATSEKTLLFTFLDRRNTGGKNIIILPPATIFETQFAFSDDTLIKKSLLLVRDKNVLGINSYTPQVEAATSGVPMLEIKPGIFNGRLQTNANPGYFELIARVSDYNGNITEEKLSDIKVSKPFRLLREDNEDPVERARVTLSVYNVKDKIFIPISPQALSIRNPVYSEPDGTVPVVLPAGTYRAEIEALGFEEKTVDFTIGYQPGEDYPTVELEKRPFSLLYGIQYILLIASDVGNTFSAFIVDLGSSRQMLTLIGFIVISSFIFLTLLALSQRSHVRISHMPRYFLSLIHLSHTESNQNHLYLGKIRDGHTKESLEGVDIFVSDVETGKVVFHTKTNAAGKFRIDLPNKYVYLLNLEKVGYHPASVHLHHFKKNEEQQFALLETEEHVTFIEGMTRLFHSLLDLSFEMLLLFSIATTLLLSYTIGFVPVLPFLALALFNLVFWGLHVIHHNADTR